MIYLCDPQPFTLTQTQIQIPAMHMPYADLFLFPCSVVIGLAIARIQGKKLKFLKEAPAFVVPLAVVLINLPLVFVSCNLDANVLTCIQVYIALKLGACLQPIGLTGGIACGKSTISKALNSDGMTTVIDLDKIAHAILLSTGPAYTPLLKMFGDEILNESKEIDRTKLGAIAFADPASRRTLGRITHPLIRRKMIVDLVMTRIGLWRPLSVFWSPRCVVEAPLLFESPGLSLLFSTIIVVSVPEDEQLKRLIKRNPELTKTQCEQRIASQLPSQVKRDGATLVVWNNETLDVIEKRGQELLHRIRLNDFPLLRAENMWLVMWCYNYFN